jgi:hypothetical protein
MNIPQNYITFVATPVLLSSVYEHVFIPKDSQSNSLFRHPTIFYILTTFLSAYPTLWTAESSQLNIYGLFAATAEQIGLFWLWVAVAHVYFSKKPFWRGVVVTLAGIIAIAATIISFRDLTGQPTKLIEQNGVLILYNYVSTPFIVLVAVEYAAMLFLAYAFLRQSNRTQDLQVKWRLRIVALGFTLVGAAFCVVPLASPSEYGAINPTQSLQMLVGIVLVALFLLATLLVRPKQK